MVKVVAFLLLAQALPERRSFGAGRSDVIRIFDEETGVACYVIPKESCTFGGGNCTYSPAISCVKVK